MLDKLHTAGSGFIGNFASRVYAIRTLKRMPRRFAADEVELLKERLEEADGRVQRAVVDGALELLRVQAKAVSGEAKGTPGGTAAEARQPAVTKGD